MSPDEPPDLEVTTLTDTATGTEGPEGARLLGWGEAVMRGFHEKRLDESRRQVLLDGLRADDVLVRGAWPRSTVVADPDLPVATYCSWVKSVNVGGGRTLPLHMLTDVTVAPTHRRRGLLRRLMTDDLQHAVEQGRPLAALTATEGAIYGRFGFGPATRLREIEVDVGPRFALREEDAEAGGTVELVEPAGVWPTVASIHARVLAGVRGTVERPYHYRPVLTGAFDHETGGPNHGLRCAVRIGPGGEPDGYVTWVHRGRDDGVRVLELTNLEALSPTATRHLWRFLADLDLVEKVRWRSAPVTGLLDWALVDPRAVITRSVRDLLWLRVLDLPTALEARPWFGTGTVVLDVDDPLGHIAGRWRVDVGPGGAAVARTGDSPDVALDVALAADTLGSLYLGDVDVVTLAAAGRLRGDDAALATLSHLADGGPLPYSTTFF